MRKPKAKLLAPLALVSAAALAVSGGLASAEGSSTGGEVQIYEADTALDGNFGTDILTGAITDHGIDHQGVADEGKYNRLVLSKGSFDISPTIGNRLNFPVDPTTCSPTAPKKWRSRSSTAAGWARTRASAARSRLQ